MASLLEYWLSEALSYNPVKRNRGWWSDGIVHLVVKSIGEKTIYAGGVSIWAYGDARREYVAPFEIEFHFEPEVCSRFAKTIVRFGLREGLDGIYLLPYGSA